MKRVINWILLFGTIISVVIALKYSSFTNGWSDFWMSSVEEQQKYVLLYDIAVGFIMSSMFYFIVDEIPNKVRMYKAIKLIRTQINQLVGCMEQVIYIVLQKYNRNQNIKELTEKDFLILNGETHHSTEEISYLTTTYNIKGNKRKTADHSFGSVNQLVKAKLQQILSNIEVIKNYEYFYASNSRLVECIRKIENCSLINLYAIDKEKKQNMTCFIYGNTSAAMIDFINLYIELRRCKIHSEYTVTELESEEKTEKYHNDRENGVLIQGVIDIQNKRKEIALANPTAIISGNKYTTDILVSQLKRNYIATYLSIDDIEVEKLNMYKYVVFVIDSNTKDTIIRLLNTNEIFASVLLVIEQSILKRSIKNKIKHNDIIDELFFKAQFRIFKYPFVIFKQEPSIKTIVDIQHKLEKTLYTNY